MIAVMKLISAVPALLLAVLLASGARGDSVTWERFKSNFNGIRALGSLPDNDASALLLQHCEITEVKPGDFDGLPNLKQIKLDHNKIQHVDAAVFTVVNGLKILSLEYNSLTEAPNFGALSLFPNMTKLKLNGNQISRLDNPETFSSIKQLERLHLHKNRIEHLHPDIFKPLTNLKSITLYENKITYIPDKLFHNPSLDTIYLAKNLISSVAPGAIGSSKLENLYLEDNKLTHLPEHFVLGLKKASASFRLVKLNDNPWQCACLLELLAEPQSAGVEYGVRPEGCPSAADGQHCLRPTQEEARAPPQSPSAMTARIG